MGIHTLMKRMVFGWMSAIALIIHETRCRVRKAFEQNVLRLFYPKRRALKPEAQAKEFTDIPSLALQA